MSGTRAIVLFCAMAVISITAVDFFSIYHRTSHLQDIARSSAISAALDLPLLDAPTETIKKELKEQTSCSNAPGASTVRSTTEPNDHKVKVITDGRTRVSVSISAEQVSVLGQFSIFGPDELSVQAHVVLVGFGEYTLFVHPETSLLGFAAPNPSLYDCEV